MKLNSAYKSAIFAGIAYIAMAIFHIPDNFFPHGFDKNAPAQLFSLLVIAGAFSLFILFKPERFRFPKIVIYGALALLLTQLISLIMSGNLLGSLIGDAGRFVGTASTLALLVISIFHSQFSYDAFRALMHLYLVAIESVAVIGIAQHFDLIELPGDQGVTSTLGNTDFYAAMIGTTLPLILFLASSATRRKQFLLLGIAAINIFGLYLAGPLQGYLDLAFLVFGIGIYLLRRFIPRPGWTLNARTFLGTFGIIIWAEFIFLMPFLGDFVPVLGNDIQVKIRSNFWLAGTRQFFDHLIFGVGPDQYGNNYEQYRTLEDIQKYTNILSNDAHSASVQTLATVGILGTLAFLFLLAITIRAFLILWDSQKINRAQLFALALFFFIYLTNSLISPITLTHKYIFWAVCGFIVGQVYRLPSQKSLVRISQRITAASFAIFFILIAGLFAQAQLNYLTHIEKYASDNSAVIDYSPSPLLPCFMYFDAELLMAANHGNDYSVALAETELANNPRCVAAEIFLAKTAVNLNRIPALKPHIYTLMQIAPARNDTISLGMFYANRAGDLKVKARLEETMKALGLVYLPGQLG